MVRRPAARALASALSRCSLALLFRVPGRGGWAARSLLA
ncbi:hypothetical protein SNOG_16271 [Parastagonospora nodorum SN15]|uniref:Uncharacterized protein n=1 Tax=Phaeosphaeria nodorum (strain SN15 / ATCC MYA-4574 / FGSC 10173) TaxID=321614 RepID=Q0TVV5_PHANO|nr:hypothetical protein SNOG_16271 [Parastagonospora nodorum SN15]EAT76257.1 hypothetical protein SNOG_16271 [Parastagonospora nodorum SN15]